MRASGYARAIESLSALVSATGDGGERLRAALDYGLEVLGLDLAVLVHGGAQAATVDTVRRSERLAGLLTAPLQPRLGDPPWRRLIGSAGPLAGARLAPRHRPALASGILARCALAHPVGSAGVRHGTLILAGLEPRARFGAGPRSLVGFLAAWSGAQVEARARARSQRASEIRARRLVDAGPDAVLVHQRGRVVYANAECAALLGARHPEALIGLAVLERVHPDHRAVIRARMRSVERLTRVAPTVEERLLRLDGSEVWAEVKAVPIEWRGEPAILLYLRDATARRRAEEAMRLAETIFHHAGEAIVVTDAATRIVRVNEAFSAVTGYRPEEVIGRTPQLLRSGRQDRAFYATLWEQLERHGQWRGEIWNRRKSGEVYPEWLDITAVRDATGVVTQYVGIFSDITRQKADEGRIRYLAYFDALTDLPNRTMLVDRLEQLLRHTLRTGELAAVLFLDLDEFKTINDSLGHDTGDELLRTLAVRLRGAVRESDTVARLGGDELVVLAAALGTRRDEALGRVTRVADKLLAAIGAPLTLGGRELRISASIGIALVPEDGERAADFLKNADTAMYRAKRAGRARYCFFEPSMNAAVRARLALDEELRRAIDEGQLELHYQPQVDAASARVLAAEALLRWHHPEEGLLEARHFLAHAEDHGLMVEIGAWALEQACSQLVAWRARPGGCPLEHVAVNIGPAELAHPRFVATLEAILGRCGLEPRHLCLELAEETLAEAQREQTLERARALAGLGVRLAVDRFGTGQSALADLQALPCEWLKLDRSLIAALPARRSAGALLRAVQALARELGIGVVAVGVERAGQRELLLAAGCARLQGRVSGAPLPPDRLVRLLEGAPGSA